MADINAAIRAKNLVALEALADRGADINDISSGVTPLGLAASMGFVKGVVYLLGLYEIEANRGEANGTSPLMLAAAKNRTRTLEKMLLFPDVDINHANLVGDTALLTAIEKGAGDSFGVLMANASINIEKANKAGITPLLSAAMNNEPLFVEALLKKGADIYHKQGDKTIYDRAAGRGFDPLINKMITNMRRFRIPFNLPISDTEVRPLASLDDVKMDIFPLTAKGESFLAKVTPAGPFPLAINSITDAERFKPEFLRMLSLVRGICSGLDIFYSMRKLEKVDMYITLTYGEPEKLIGFIYVTLYKTAKDLFIDLVCTRNNVKGAGAFLMDFCIKMAISARYKQMTLDSVNDAVTFYEKFGFIKLERSDEDYIAELQPMVLTLPYPVKTEGKTIKTAFVGKKTTRKKRTAKKPVGHGAGTE